jgi:hypothetical protein
MSLEERILKFIIEKNKTQNLGLNMLQIRELAVEYYQAASDKDLTYIDDEVLSDELFQEVFDAYDKDALSDETLADADKLNETIRKMDQKAFDDIEEEYSDDDLRLDSNLDKRKNQHYGYGFTDRDDDLGLDEVADDDETMHISM